MTANVNAKKQKSTAPKRSDASQRALPSETGIQNEVNSITLKAPKESDQTSAPVKAEPKARKRNSSRPANTSAHIAQDRLKSIISADRLQLSTEAMDELNSDFKMALSKVADVKGDCAIELVAEGRSIHINVLAKIEHKKNRQHPIMECASRPKE